MLYTRVVHNVIYQCSPLSYIAVYPIMLYTSVVHNVIYQWSPSRYIPV